MTPEQMAEAKKVVDAVIDYEIAEVHKKMELHGIDFEVSASQISAEALEALERLRGDTSERAMQERAYWERFPASVKYVEHIVLRDDALGITLVKHDGVWEMPR